MKRPPRIFTYIIIFLFATTQTAFGAGGKSFRFYLNEAKQAIKSYDYPKALYYIQTAHAADPSSEEPFELLVRIPTFSEYEQSFKYFYDLATDYYNQGDYETAWFYYRAARQVDPQIDGVRQAVEHVDRVIHGFEQPRVQPVKRVHRQPVSHRQMSVDVYPDLAKGPPYVVEHSPQVDAILAKYQPDAVSQRTPVTARRRSAVRSEPKTKIANRSRTSPRTETSRPEGFIRTNLAQEAIRTRRAQRTPTAPVSQPSQRRVKLSERELAMDAAIQAQQQAMADEPADEPAVKTSDGPVSLEGKDVRSMVSRFRGERKFKPIADPALKSAESNLREIKESFMPSGDSSQPSDVSAIPKDPTTVKKVVSRTTPRISPISKTMVTESRVTKAPAQPRIKSESVYEARQRQRQRSQIEQRKTISSTRKEVIEAENLLELDSDLWSKQPGTVIEIEFDQTLEMRGRQVRRFVAFEENVIDVQRKDKDSIFLTAIQRGSTLFHVWDETGRWTFNIKGVLPTPKYASQQRIEDDLVTHVNPFQVSYSNNWNSFYVGDRIQDLERRTINFTQWVGVYGPTPYGYFDASGNFFKFAESTENTGRTVGLSNANFGPFEDFNIRGWDASKRFSNLSLPGRSFRGILFDSYSFDRMIKYTVLRGQDRAVFSQISEGVVEVRKSYIEGARITLFPDEPNNYSINYSRGFGQERAKFLKDKVFSFEAKNRLGPFDTHFEHADDEEDTARLLLTEYKQDDLSLRVNIRDIEPGFTTITSRPSGRGEVGGNIIFDYNPDEFQFSSNLDIYRDREFFNPSKRNGLNYDVGAVFGMPLSETVKWNNSIFYTDTPQLISPRENLRLNTTLSKSFEFFNKKTLQTFFTASYQMSRFDLSPTSEYDRYGVSIGVRLPIYRNLSYFANYDYNWVDVTMTGQKTNPHVFYTGLNYYQNFGNNFSMRLSATYRDEENTDQPFSFLSGTDTLRGNIGLSYRPTPDIEIFLDGSMRNVWTENPAEPAFNDADLRMGVRASWDTVFRWDPAATIRGTVYKDLNRNSQQDPGEPGIEDIEIQLGRKIVKSNRDGRYKGRVRAKSIKMGVNFDSVPKGYNLLSYLKKEVEIENGETYNIDFGFITRSGIYGVVFHDANGNKTYDDGEETLARARIKLDGKEIVETDFEGVFNFYDIAQGEHTLVIDVNSLPMEYLPTIKVRNTVFVEEGTTQTFHVPLKRK